MNKDYIDALWHEAELASINSDLEIHQIFYKLIEKNIRADEREACLIIVLSKPVESIVAWEIVDAIKARGERFPPEYLAAIRKELELEQEVK